MPLSKPQEGTLVLIKPDALEWNLEEQIIQEYTRAGFEIVAQKHVYRVNDDLLRLHYKEHYEENPELYKKLNREFVGKTVIALILMGNDAVAKTRSLNGATNPATADKQQSIRGKYGSDSYELADKEGRSVQNLVHGSDSLESAGYEMTVWFSSDEILKLPANHPLSE